MPHYLFDQLEFVRKQTLKAVEGLSEEMSDRVPEGFRNTIRWQLGHIHLVTERFAFHFAGLPVKLPESFPVLFGNGTSPLETPEGAVPPTLEELRNLLALQPERIRHDLPPLLHKRIDPPYVTSTGMRLETTEQMINFSLYHEGMHFSVIKLYKKLLQV